MRRVFADTYYWIALINDRDQGHAAAVAISLTLQQATLFTTQEVLSEVLTFFCDEGPYVRQTVAAYVRDILSNPCGCVAALPIQPSTPSPCCVSVLTVDHIAMPPRR